MIMIIADNMANTIIIMVEGQAVWFIRVKIVEDATWGAWSPTFQQETRGPAKPAFS